MSTAATAKFFVNQGVVSSRTDMQNLLRPTLKQTVPERDTSLADRRHDANSTDDDAPRHGYASAAILTYSPKMRTASATTVPLRSSTSLRRPLRQSCSTVVVAPGTTNRS